MYTKSKRVVLLILTGCVIMGLSGCGKTSSEKPDPGTEEIWWQKALEQKSVEQYRYQAPEIFQDQWEDSTGKLKVVIDANICMPDEPGYAIEALTQHPVNETFLQRIQSAVVPAGEMLYKADDTIQGWPEDMYVPRMSKKDMQTWIDYFVTTLQDPNSPLNQIKDTDPERYDFGKTVLEESLGQYREQIGQLPDGFCETSTEKIALENAEATSAYLFEAGKPTQALLYIMHDITGYYSISFSNKGLYDYSGSMYQPNTYGGQINTDQENLQGSKLIYQQAYSQAKSLADTLGIGQRMQRANSWSGHVNIGGVDIRPCYYFSFVNAQNGLIDRDVFWAQRKFSSENTADTARETFIVCVDDEGIVSFDWMNPCSVERAKENVLLMDFAQMMEQRKGRMDILADMLGTYEVSDLRGDAVVESDRLEVNTVELCYCTMDYEGQTYLVPTWNFYGKWTRKYKNASDSVEPDRTNENSELTYEGSLCCLFSVNAIDGSIVIRPEN